MSADPDTGATPARRRYDSPIRRQQAAETRARIVAAGAELAHGFSKWNWQGMTVRAVAERAGVNERTVYRHFGSERELRDAVMGRLTEEAGVPLDELELDSFADHAAQVYRYLASFPTSPSAADDPTFSDVDVRRRDSLARAVESATEGWPDDERRIVSAVLDVFWTVPTYERMLGAWELGPDEAGRAARWIIGLVRQALSEDHRPGS